MQHVATLTIKVLLISAGALVLGCTGGPFARPDTGPSYAANTDSPEHNSSLELSDLDPDNVGRATRKLTGRGPNRQVAYQVYQEADAQFRQAEEARRAKNPSAEQFLEAAERFEEAAVRWPASALEQDALFAAGESYFFADDYPNATKLYAQLMKKYANTRYLDQVSARQFSLAKYWLDLDREDPRSLNLTDDTRPLRGTGGKAIKILDRIRLDDPTGQLADDATMAAGNAYFQSGKFLDAADFYEDLRRTFPQSEHQFTAHLLELKSRLESYQGPQYDDNPLQKADKLLTQIRRQFPRESDEHREYLARAFADIRFRKAEREMANAQYYDRRGEFAAARYYYDVVLNEYSDTPLGQSAYERVAQIQSEPDKPPQRLGWLVKLFPQPEEAKPLIPGGQVGPLLR